MLAPDRRLAPRVALALCGCLIAGLAAATRAAETDARQRDVDRLFTQWDRRDSPGCALGVFKDGRVKDIRFVRAGPSL